MPPDSASLPVPAQPLARQRTAAEFPISAPGFPTRHVDGRRCVQRFFIIATRPVNASSGGTAILHLRSLEEDARGKKCRIGEENEGGMRGVGRRKKPPPVPCWRF